MESLPLNHSSWNSFEHELYRLCVKLGVRERPLLVAVSGGVDSMALIKALESVRSTLKLSLVVGHIHHGTHENRDYRHLARETVRAYCKKQNIPFLTNSTEPPELLKSESELRDFRKAELSKMQGSLVKLYKKRPLIAEGHNANELLETRVMRLIRGSGAQGLKAMSELSEETFRPFLSKSKSELEAYCKERGVMWLEDPSNSEKKAFRNWLRHEWLPQLEEKLPGSLSSFSRSLSQLSFTYDQHQQENFAEIIVGGSIVAPKFRDLEKQRQLLVLSRFMREKTMKNYTKNHMLEVLKRLDSPQKTHTFSLLRHRWEINPDRIKAQPC